MSFERPTLTVLVARIETDMLSRLPLTGAILRRAMVKIVARVLAGAVHMLYGHLEYLGRQLFADQSDDAYLVRQASLYGITKIAASYTELVLEGAGDGTAVPAGTVLVSAAGDQFLVDTEVSTTPTLVLNVTALEAGAFTRLEVGDVLTFESPIAGVDSTAEVTVVTTDGDDAESTEALRTRLLALIADPPHGGTLEDYVAWAKEVPGVTRAWATAGDLGPGTVVVRFVRDNDPSIFPDSGEVADVQAVLDTEAPAHATPTAIAPIDATTLFEMTIVPDNSTTRAAVTAELDDLFQREAEPGGTILLSSILTTIGTSAGITDFTLLEPPVDVTAGTANTLLTRGVITWS